MKHLVIVLLYTASAWSTPAILQIDDLNIQFDTKMVNPLAHEEVHPIIKERMLSRGIDGRIVNGSPATVGQFPWQAALFLQVSGGTAFCGGSVISPTVILTAAHCTQGVSAITTHVGGISTNANEVGKSVVSVQQVIPHEQYSGSNLANDISLLRLVTALPTAESNIGAILLEESQVGAAVRVTVSGWGRISNSATSISPVLNYVDLTTISNEDCQAVFGSVVQDYILCAQGATIESTCNGDSGGALVINYPENPTQVGIVSFGSSRGCDIGIATGYTRVSQYIDWIAARIAI